MKIIQDGRELVFHYHGNPQRTTLTLLEPYKGGIIHVKATDFPVDIEPVGISLEIGFEVHLTANPEWQSDTPTA